jgi:hypothetical protein
MTTPTERSSCDLAPETERTVSDLRSRPTCGNALTNRRRQARFCSDRCRAQAARSERQRRLVAIVDTLSGALRVLKRELALDSE